MGMPVVRGDKHLVRERYIPNLLKGPGRGLDFDYKASVFASLI